MSNRLLKSLSTCTLAVHTSAGSALSTSRTPGTVAGMGRAKDAVGAYGERVAVEYLIGQGMTLIERNWRCSAGEVDAILLEHDTAVFAEVKTRRGDAFGSPAEAIGYAKQSRLRRLAALWLAESGMHPTEIRFDIVAVRPQRAGAATVEHVRGAF